MANGNSRDSHDQNFKNLILDYPREALAFFAAAEAPAADDRVAILPIRQEQLKERLGDRFRELDVPLLVEWEDGHREVLLFVLEEETDPRRFSLHRLAHYCLDLCELFETDRVVPVVIFLRSVLSVPQNLSLGSERHEYLSFDYLSCVLSTMPFEDWADSDNLVARLNLPNMQWSTDDKIQAYAQAIRGLLSLEPDPDKRAKYIDFIDIYAALTDNERRRYEQEYPEEEKAMAGIMQRAREEGIEQGIEQGMQQGRLEGERAVLQRLLQSRFGPLSTELLDKLEAASANELERWADNVLDAQTLDDLFD